PQAVRLPRLLRRGAENRIGVSDMRIWMFRFKQNRHFNPLGGSLLKMCVFWWGRLVQQMLAGLCKPLRWYAPATTRREPVPGGSLMSSLTSNGRVRGVPAQRQKLGSCWCFSPSGSECVGGLGVQGCAD